MSTAHEALRQLTEVCKLVDFADCAESEELWHKLNAAQQVAEEVLKRPGQEPVAYIRTGGLGNLKAGRTAVVYPCYTDSDQSFCLYAVPVAAQPAVAAVPEGYVLVPLTVTDEMIVSFAEEWYSKRQCIDDPDMADAYKAMLAAAPQPAAAPSGDVEDELRGEGWLRAISDVSAILPSTYYMDQPDGGSVTVLEQVERMAKDAERYRWLKECNSGCIVIVHLIAPDEEVVLTEIDADISIDAAITATKE